MKRFFLSLCFVAFLSAGLVSCNDDAAEITPNNIDVSAESYMTDDKTDRGSNGTRPK